MHGRMQAAWALWCDWAGNLNIWAATLLQGPHQTAQMSGRKQHMHFAQDEGDWAAEMTHRQ